MRQRTDHRRDNQISSLICTSLAEITTKAKVDYEAIVRKTCREIGFISDEVGLDCDKCKVRAPLGARNTSCSPQPTNQPINQLSTLTHAGAGPH